MRATTQFPEATKRERIAVNTKELQAISLKKAWWGCGAASALTEAVLAFAKENGFEQLNLEVRSDNARAIRLYEKYGFRKLCTFPDFFKIDGESIDFDLMNLELTSAGD